MNIIKPSEVAELSIEQLATKENLIPLEIILQDLWDNAQTEEDHYNLYLLKQAKAHLIVIKQKEKALFNFLNMPMV